MEIEIKLSLPNSAAHQRLSDALSPFHLHTHHQENHFFDGAAGELSAHLAAARLRFYNNSSSRCILSLKSRPLLLHGVSRVEELEDEIDPSLGRACLASPSLLNSLPADSKVMGRIRDEFGVKEGADFVWLGGFRNVRAVYGWKEGVVLEVDETRFDFGVRYELECETEEPERVKGAIEEFLVENGVEFGDSRASKFAVFRAGKMID